MHLTFRNQKNCTQLECGEDSFSISENKNGVVIGVADGVGGWGESGVDSSVFAQTLMYHVAELTNKKFKNYADRSKALIHDAFWRLVEDFKSLWFKHRVCVVMINKETG